MCVRSVRSVRWLPELIIGYANEFRVKIYTIYINISVSAHLQVVGEEAKKSSAMRVHLYTKQEGKWKL